MHIATQQDDGPSLTVKQSKLAILPRTGPVRAADQRFAPVTRRLAAFLGRCKAKTFCQWVSAVLWLGFCPQRRLCSSPSFVCQTSSSLARGSTFSSNRVCCPKRRRDRRRLHRCTVSQVSPHVQLPPHACLDWQKEACPAVLQPALCLSVPVDPSRGLALLLLVHCLACRRPCPAPLFSTT
jgi:hypothetical protein